jgi:hypothetical protein
VDQADQVKNSKDFPGKNSYFGAVFTPVYIHSTFAILYKQVYNILYDTLYLIVYTHCLIN